MKVILAITNDYFPTVIKLTPPTSLLYLVACLQDQDCEVKVIDPILEKMSVESFVDTIISESPDIFGLSITSDVYFSAARIFKAVKARLPRIVNIAGGPHPTLMAGQMFDNLPELDIAVRGDGEHVLPMIIQRLKKKESLRGVPNTTFRENGQVVHNKEKHVIFDLDSVPFPSYDAINFERYNFTYPVKGKGEVPSINMITSRGCPFDCIFCSNTNLSERKVRYRSIDNVIEEMKLRMDTYGIKLFWFQDDAFNLSRKRVLEFCDRLEEEQFQVYWTSVLRADNADYEILSRMKEVGFIGGYFAIETVNDRLRQNVIGKKLHMEQAKKVIKAFNDLDLWVGINFVVSLPDETRTEMEENISFIENLNLKHEESSVNFNIIKIYPGTRLEKVAFERGILKEGFNWFDKKSIRRLSPGVLLGLYGDEPIYKEHLSYIDIFSCLFRWKYSPNYAHDPGASDNLLYYLWRYVCRIRYFKDFKILGAIGLAWLKVIVMRIRHPINRK